MKLFPLILAVLTFYTNTTNAQDNITIEDYNRAKDYLYENYSENVFNLNINANWLSDNTGLWFVEQSPEQKKKFLSIKFSDKTVVDLFDHKKVAQALADSLDSEVDANDLPISRIQYLNPKELIITTKQKSFLLNTKTYTLSSPPNTKSDDYQYGRNRSEIDSPDKKWSAFTKDHNLYIKSKKTDSIFQLSHSGKKNYEYATWYGWTDIIEGENSERPEHFHVNWREDSQWILANICDLRSANKMYLLDWSVDTLYRPKLLSYFRGSPGDTGMIYMEPVFFNINSKKEVKVDLPRSTHINSINVSWSESKDKVYLDRHTRGFKNFSIYTFDLNKEKLDTLYTESSKTNVENFHYELIEKSGLMLFLSEKSGWRQMYSLDLKTKQEKAITTGEFVINNILRVDEKNKKIFFLASGKEKGQNPYYQNLYSVSFSGKGLKLLTREHRHHQISLSPDGNYFVDNYSTINNPTITVLRSSNTGEIIIELGRANTEALKGWTAPKIFTAIAHDNKTTIYGALWKPSNFDSTKQYPVIEYSYTGPHTQMFPKQFDKALEFQSLAELGFLVITIDGLGSSGRSKAFHDYSYKNLGNNLTDHVRAIKQLGRKYSWVDTTRVGIYGHSAGGYDAGHAVLAFPDFYKVAVASSADHDHRMEKAWWPEMYMGWPVDSVYHLQSNITMANNLKGKLFLIHGGIDENVNPSATFKLAEALIKSDKPFDMLILPSQRHGYRGVHYNYVRKARWNYFVEHLRGSDPIWNF